MWAGYHGLGDCQGGAPGRIAAGAGTVLRMASTIEAQVATAALQAAMDALQRAFPRHSWTGIYLLRGDELLLGPFVGPPTEHVRIPRGRGLCGRAVREEKDLNVGDVR